MRDWFTWSHRLRSIMINSVQPGDPGEPIASRGPENQGSQECNPGLSPKSQGQGALKFEGRRRWMFQLKQRSDFPFLCLFVLFGPSIDWIVPTLTGNGDLDSVHWCKCSPLLETLSQTHPECFFASHQVSCRPVKLIQENHHRSSLQAQKVKETDSPLSPSMGTSPRNT